MADDIVERLRKSTWRDCIEAADEIEWLRAKLARNADECRETLTELHQRVETLTAERDEANANAKLYRDDRDVARREVCARFALIYSMTVQEVEKLRGWDCFKEPAHAP